MLTPIFADSVILKHRPTFNYQTRCINTFKMSLPTPAELAKEVQDINAAVWNVLTNGNIEKMMVILGPHIVSLSIRSAKYLDLVCLLVNIV